MVISELNQTHSEPNPSFSRNWTGIKKSIAHIPTSKHVTVYRNDIVLGEFGICIWDERCPLSRIDTDEWWRPQVSYTQHGQSWLWGGSGRLLCSWNHLRTKASACREHCLQVVSIWCGFKCFEIFDDHVWEISTCMHCVVCSLSCQIMSPVTVVFYALFTKNICRRLMQLKYKGQESFYSVCIV